MTTVAIQGYRGCFHEEAARKFYSARGEEITIEECPTFESLFKALSEGRASSVVMAIENTISGGLLPNFELLRANPYKIKGEVYIPIHQNLMALPGQRVEDIKEVRTHYMAINQTRLFFERNCPWIKMVESEDTAKSAIEISEGKLMGIGAVASELAAAENGLVIVAAAIEIPYFGNTFPRCRVGVGRLLKEFCSLKAFWQLLTNCLLYNSWACKAYQGLWLCKSDIT